MKKLLLLAAALFFVTNVRAQSTSSTWRDVTAAPYSVKNDCSASASSGINSAISAAPPTGNGSVVVFFPAGCYLITAQLVDTNSSANITYLGFGNVELRASSSSPPSNSIIQFGNDSTSVTARRIEHLYFNCNGQSIDGVDVDGMDESEFDSVTIANCHGPQHAHLRTVGTNTNNDSLKFVGGAIYGDATGENGVQVGVSYIKAFANAWSFYGTKIVGSGSTSGNGNGVGVDLSFLAADSTMEKFQDGEQGSTS